MWLLLQVLVFSTFKVPSSSMSPTLQVGDVIYVNKLVLGGRLFDINKALNREPINIIRLPGYRLMRRGDIVVFNNPYPHNKRKMEMDMMQYYVKRCIALPGDTIQIVDAHYWVNNQPIGYSHNQDLLERWVVDNQEVEPKPQGYRAFVGWNVGQWGPLYVPQAGDSLTLTPHAARYYQRCIEWETGWKLKIENGGVYADGRLIKGYRFHHNLYFMAGDNCLDSRDSRYWGLLPEPFIVGCVTRICYNQSNQKGFSGWSRFWKAVN